MSASGGACAVTLPESIRQERTDLDEYAEMIEAMAADPDGFEPTERSNDLLKRYAMSGAVIGMSHCMPKFVSVDGEFLRGSSC